MSNESVINIIITGVGGQGNILASQLVALAAIEDGWFASIGETYGASQRGGSVMSHVRLSRDFQVGPLIPKNEAHVVVGFEPLETLRVLIDYGNPKTKVIVNPRPTYPIGVAAGIIKYPEVDAIIKAMSDAVAEVRVVAATDLAQDMGLAIAQNVVMVGALAGSGYLPIKQDSFRKAMKEALPADKVEFNADAFGCGVKGIHECMG